MSSKFENIFRINRKSRFATLGGFETSGAFFLGYTWIWSTVKYTVFELLKCCTSVHTCPKVYTLHIFWFRGLILGGHSKTTLKILVLLWPPNHPRLLHLRYIFHAMLWSKSDNTYIHFFNAVFECPLPYFHFYVRLKHSVLLKYSLPMTL